MTESLLPNEDLVNLYVDTIPFFLETDEISQSTTEELDLDEISLEDIPEPMEMDDAISFFDLPEDPGYGKREINYFYLYRGIKRFWNGKMFLCEHKKQKSRCEVCGGSGFCRHRKRIENCNECGKKYFCIHRRKKNSCKMCTGSCICIHGKRRQYCKECGGSSLCIHNRQRYHCYECGGKGICIHLNRKHRCKICKKLKKK